MAEHAVLNPSGASQRKLCRGSLAAQLGAGNKTSFYAAEGTAAHELCKVCLQNATQASNYLGTIIRVEGYEIEVDDEMADAVQTYLDNVRDYAGGHPMFIEQKVCHGPMIDLPDELAWGTSDCIIILPREVQVHDYKHGRGVIVSPEGNSQGIAYALGALRFVRDVLGDDLDEYDTVRIVIHQPRTHPAPQEWDVSVKDLLEVYAVALAKTEADAYELLLDRISLQELDDGGHLTPGESQCKFCNILDTCPAKRRQVSEAITGDFDVLDDELELAPRVQAPQGVDHDRLAYLLSVVDQVQSWASAVMAAADEAFAHGKATGRLAEQYKMVEGRKGRRSWAYEPDAEAALKAMRLKQDEMYARKLISPTQALALLKESPRKVKTLEPLIQQANGKPTVVPIDDKRPAVVYQAPSNDFEDLADTAPGIEDLA